MEKKVSVIIPCYNLPEYDCDNGKKSSFDICMDSVLNQSIGLDCLEIILINDASEDGGYTSKVLWEYEERYPEQILVVELSENQRQGGARNIGLSYARGEYIAFLDADDWVDVSLYEKAYCSAAEHVADMVYFFHQARKGELCVPMDDMETPAGLYVVSTVEQRKAFIMAQVVDYRCTTKLYKRSLLQETGVAFPHHMIYEEPVFTYPLQFYAERFVVLPELLYNYRMNPRSTMNTSHTFDKLSNHPKVQLQLFAEMADRGLMETYYDEISYHFLHSYFLETLLFAADQGVDIPEVFFRKMQQTVLHLLPDWKDNRYIKGEPDCLLAQVLTQGLGRRMHAQDIGWLCRFVQRQM